MDFDLPIRDIRFWNCRAIFSMDARCGGMVFTCLPFCDEVRVNASHSVSKKLQSLSCLRSSTTIVKMATAISQSSLVTGVRNLTSMWIGSFEKFCSCDMFFWRTHIAYALLLINRGPSGLFKMLQALPESTSRLEEMFPFLMGTMRGSVFSRSSFIVKTIVSSSLL